MNFWYKQLRIGIHSNLKVEGSRPACAQVFSKTSPENSSGAENSSEISGTNGINFFCYKYESSLRHPVWVPEINVKACNSVCPLPLGTQAWPGRCIQPTLARKPRRGMAWHGMTKDMAAWCRDCQACLAAKVPKQLIVKVQPIPVSDARFTHVHGDFMGPLPISVW
jgi:hypothetical protein